MTAQTAACLFLPFFFKKGSYLNRVFFSINTIHVTYLQSHSFKTFYSVVSTVPRAQRTVLSNEAVCKVFWRAGKWWQSQGNEGLPHIYKGSQAHQSFAIQTLSDVQISLHTFVKLFQWSVINARENLRITAGTRWWIQIVQNIYNSQRPCCSFFLVPFCV